MKLIEMSPEQREAKRKYDREAKQRSRAMQKAHSYIPSADEATDNFDIEFPDRAKELTAYAKQLADKVTEELCRELGAPQMDSTGSVVGWDLDEEFTVDRVARTLLGLRKMWIQKVQEPDGELVSGLYFADSFGSMVDSAHRHGLTKSYSFNLHYRELLQMLDKRYGRDQTEDAAIIRAELAGTYILPPLPELPKTKPPKPEPKKIQEVPLSPSDAEMLEAGRLRLLNQLQSFRVQDPNISPTW